MVQLHTDWIGRMQRPRDADQYLCEVRKDPPVVCIIGIGQRGARHTTVKTHMVELASERSQTGLNVAETVPVGQLGERHRQILIPARETARSRIAAVASHAAAKLTIWQKAQQLGEDCSALIHAPLLSDAEGFSFGRRSNRGKPKAPSTLDGTRACQRGLAR